MGQYKPKKIRNPDYREPARLYQLPVMVKNELKE